MNMLEYIKETPSVLKHVLATKNKALDEVVGALKDRDIEHIYLVGSGTSCFAGIGAKNFIEDVLATWVTPIVPNAFIDQNTIKGEKVIVFGISQSGGSTSTMRALEVARTRGNICVSVAGEINTEIEKLGDYHVHIDCGTEVAVAKTKGYIATLLMCYLIGLELAKAKATISQGKYDDLLHRLSTTVENIGMIIDKSEKWADTVKSDLTDKHQFMVVGYQNQWATVQEAALKLLETVRIGVSGYEVEEFMHGIYNAINDQSVLFYIGSASEKYFERGVKLMNYLSKSTSFQYFISAEKNENARCLTLNFVDDEYFSPMEYIVPFQMLCYKVAVAKGINPSLPSDPEFHKNMNSKIKK